MLQVSLILLTLLSCVWQCYSTSSLQRQLSTLKQPHPHTSVTPPTRPHPPDHPVELLGSTSQSPKLALPKSATPKSVAGKSDVDNKEKRRESDSLPLSRSKSTGVRRCSSVSDLVGRSTGIQAKLSQSDYLGAKGAVEGGGERRRGEEEGEGEDDVWLASSSLSNLDSYVVSFLSPWLLFSFRDTSVMATCGLVKYLIVAIFDLQSSSWQPASLSRKKKKSRQFSKR